MAYLEYLKNPQANELYHHYRYMKVVYVDHSNPYVVVGCIIAFLSTFQYLARLGMYESAIKSAMETTHFKSLVNAKYIELLETQPNIVTEYEYVRRNQK